jgi:hypothetical protein
VCLKDCALNQMRIAIARIVVKLSGKREYTRVSTQLHAKKHHVRAPYNVNIMAELNECNVTRTCRLRMQNSFEVSSKCARLMLSVQEPTFSTAPR